MSKTPNPQGKGLAPVLEYLASSRVQASVPAKNIEQIANELFTSMFVLNSQFQFKPVVGQRYWLYRQNGSFRLSLVSPKEWGGTAFGQYIGECKVQDDLTWTLELGEEAACDEELHELIATRRREFEKSLQQADRIDNALPFYQESLPFYQRVMAASLSNSLKISMQLSDIQTLTYNQARGLIEKS